MKDYKITIENPEGLRRVKIRFKKNNYHYDIFMTDKKGVPRGIDFYVTEVWDNGATLVSSKITEITMFRHLMPKDMYKQIADNFNKKPKDFKTVKMLMGLQQNKEIYNAAIWDAIMQTNKSEIHNCQGGFQQREITASLCKLIKK